MLAVGWVGAMVTAVRVAVVKVAPVGLESAVAKAVAAKVAHAAEAAVAARAVAQEAAAMVEVEKEEAARAAARGGRGRPGGGAGGAHGGGGVGGGVGGVDGGYPNNMSPAYAIEVGGGGGAAFGEAAAESSFSRRLDGARVVRCEGEGGKQVEAAKGDDDDSAQQHSDGDGASAEHPTRSLRHPALASPPSASVVGVASPLRRVGGKFAADSAHPRRRAAWQHTTNRQPSPSAAHAREGFGHRWAATRAICAAIVARGTTLLGLHGVHADRERGSHAIVLPRIHLVGRVETAHRLTNPRRRSGYGSARDRIGHLSNTIVLGARDAGRHRRKPVSVT